MEEIKKIFDYLIGLPRKENEWLELKESKNSYDFDDLGKYFSALSNEANLSGKESGWLIFGYSEKLREIVGTNYRTNPQSLHKLKFEISEHTSNKISFTEIYELFIDNKRVLLFQIPPASPGIPVSWKGYYYGRDGESLVGLKIDEIERIRSQHFNSDWSSLVCEKATIDDLDEDAVKLARERYIAKHKSMEKEINEWDTITFLNKARITINGKMTNTAIILLGKPEAEIHIKPAIAQISWILKDHNNEMLDYEHFHPPFIINTSKVFKKIRNLKYRYMTDRSLFPEEIDKYDSYVIREALHNCIAHQDYSLSGKINLVEKPDELIFENVGNFFIQLSIEELLTLDTPPETYRNTFLANAMVEIGMIDTVGSGILRMFKHQRERFFPLPEYDLSNPNKVKLTILGKILDPNYTKLLIQNTEISLQIIALLDKVQKNESITNEAVKQLKKMKLIEGRKPNFYIAGKIAKITGEKANYIKNRGFDKDHYQKMIIEYLKKFSSASRLDIDKLLLDKLPDVLDEQQKKNKIRNLLHEMKKNDLIYCNKRGKISEWFIQNPYV